MNEDDAGKKCDVCVCHNDVIAVMLQHPVLALQLGLAGEGASTGAATVRIHFQGILRRTDGEAAEIRRVLRDYICLVEGDGGGCIDRHSEKDCENGVDNTEDDFGLRGGITGGAVCAWNVEVTDVWGGL